MSLSLLIFLTIIIYAIGMLLTKITDLVKCVSEVKELLKESNSYTEPSLSLHRFYYLTSTKLLRANLFSLVRIDEKLEKLVVTSQSSTENQTINDTVMKNEIWDIVEASQSMIDTLSRNLQDIEKTTDELVVQQWKDDNLPINIYED